MELPHLHGYSMMWFVSRRYLLPRTRPPYPAELRAEALRHWVRQADADESRG